MEASEIDIATATAQAARDAWAPIWPQWKRLNGHPAPDGLPSYDACVPTSLALCRALRITVPTFRWRAAGGRPTRRTSKAGFRDAKGRIHPHLWVQGSDGPQIVVADITADQFDGCPVIVAVDDPRYVANATRPLLRRYAENESLTVLWLISELDRKFTAMKADLGA